MKLYIVDAFARVPFGGNPAGVVLLGEEPFPDDVTMRRTAAELRHSETAFVRRIAPGVFHTRYFTPVAEVSLCGHATLAAFHVLREAEGESGPFENHTAAGILRVEALGGKIFMEMGKPAYLRAIDAPREREVLYRALGLDAGAARDGRLPPACVSTGLPDIILPVRETAELASIAPDFAAICALSRAYAVTGVHAFVPPDAGGPIHCRNFAPLYGIDEEAATGTANGALAFYLYRHGLACGDAPLTFLQGETMGRPSIIEGRLSLEAGGLTVWIGGGAVIVVSGRLHL